jgi:hypothetical protein
MKMSSERRIVALVGVAAALLRMMMMMTVAVAGTTINVEWSRLPIDETEIRAMVFFPDVQTVRSRGFRSPLAMACVGGDCGIQLSRVDCLRNTDMTWSCTGTAAYPTTLRFELSNAEIQCQGYEHQDDLRVLPQGCALSYHLKTMVPLAAAVRASSDVPPSPSPPTHSNRPSHSSPTSFPHPSPSLSSSEFAHAFPVESVEVGWTWSDNSIRLLYVFIVVIFTYLVIILYIAIIRAFTITPNGGSKIKKRVATPTFTTNSVHTNVTHTNAAHTNVAHTNDAHTNFPFAPSPSPSLLPSLSGYKNADSDSGGEIAHRNDGQTFSSIATQPYRRSAATARDNMFAKNVRKLSPHSQYPEYAAGVTDFNGSTYTTLTPSSWSRAIEPLHKDDLVPDTKPMPSAPLKQTSAAVTGVSARLREKKKTPLTFETLNKTNGSVSSETDTASGVIPIVTPTSTHKAVSTRLQEPIKSFSWPTSLSSSVDPSSNVTAITSRLKEEPTPPSFHDSPPPPPYAPPSYSYAIASIATSTATTSRLHETSLNAAVDVLPPNSPPSTSTSLPSTSVATATTAAHSTRLRE